MVSNDAACELGRTLRSARLKLKLTGAQVRERSGVDPTSLSMFERGVRIPPRARIGPLAAALGLSPRRLERLALAATEKARAA